MNYSRWNALNNKTHLFCVVDITTKNILLQNLMFEEFIAESGKTVQDLFSMGNHGSCLIEEITAYLQQQPQTPGGGGGLMTSAENQAAYTKRHTHLIMEKWVDIDILAGFFNKECTEIYITFNGYSDIMKFIRFKASIAKIPENIVLLELNDELSLYGGNRSFEKTFSNDKITFAQRYSGSFSAALCDNHRQAYLDLIHDSITKGEQCSFVIEIYTAGGQRHYAYFNAMPVEDMLNHTILCTTIQIIDSSVEEYLELKQANAVLELSSQFSQSVSFYLNIKTLMAKFYGELVQDFNLQNIDDEFPAYARRHNLIYHEDAPAFKEMMQSILNGVEAKFRMRLNARDGRHDWYLVEYRIQYDEEGLPMTAMGKVTNIQMTKELQDKADTDPLTGCLNKSAFAMSIQSFFQMNGPGNHVFMIIDVDNFKAINDNLGHFFGDIVLKEISSKLRRIFREDDYVARIGGDEFAVLMRNVTDLSIIERKSKEVLAALDITYKGNGTFYRITASVGVSMSPRDSITYEGLYKQADLALYRAKAAGKNVFSIYSPSMEKGTMENRTPIDLASRALSSHFNQEIAMDAFNLLFNSEDSTDSVDALLRHLGEYYNVDRCYVFEINEEYPDSYDNTYEWCAPGITPQKDELQRLPMSAFQETFDLANDDGIYYCNDISTIQSDLSRETLAMQGIQSLLLTFVKRHGKVEYVLGFDDCTSKRIWKPMEISTLSYTSKIIAQYLLYQRAIGHEMELSREKTAVLDALNFYAYIVDRETYEIAYFNRRTKEAIPDLELGDLCYKALRGLDAPCHDCPLVALREKGAKRIRKLIHNQQLDLELITTASYLEQFTGRACAFLSSSNINDIARNTNLGELDRDIFTIYD